MDIKKELSSNKTILVLMNSSNYNSQLTKIMKSLKGKNICYVTTNKTYESLKEAFVKSKISLEKVVFIDAISKTIKQMPDQSENVYYVSSPGSLTEISLVVSKFLNHNFDYLIFDSLSNLGIYNKMNLCVKFMVSLSNNIKKSDTRSLFYFIGNKKDEILNHASMFVDKVVEIKR
jgi:KaiC/GvpD/RAD55 family RecA-like ATPase